MKNTLHVWILSVALISGSAFAAGEHAGGHDEETFGKPGDPAKVTRTVKVEMYDTMRYKPASINVKRGETIRFEVVNKGKIDHEFVLGEAKTLKEHAEMMRKFPDMEHADPNQVEVEPGKTGELVWQFTKPGKFDFACLIPGHFEAGMKGKLSVRK